MTFTSPFLRRATSPTSLVLAGVVAFIVLGPTLAAYQPLTISAAGSLQPPSSLHLMGTDALGRDVLSRFLYGGQHTLGVAALATAISVLPGIVLGAAAGYWGHWIEKLFTASIDILLAFPNLLLALLLLTLTGSGSLQVAAAVGVANLPAYARITRSAVQQVVGEPYIEAARSLGAGPLRLLLRHILPNALDAMLSFGAITFSWAIINSAALTFLGFSGDPSIPDWGMMLNEGRAVFRVAPWVALAPGTAITLTVYLVNRTAALWDSRG